MRHRIAIGGIHIESSTFSPHRSGPADFTVVRGDELLARHHDLPGDVDWLPLVHARALPGGAVERDFYESVKAELLERLRATLPLDGVFLDIHGAMSVVGMTDAEGDLTSAVRDIVGPEALISAARLEHGLTQVLRIALEGPFDPQSASRGLKALLARDADVPDFSVLVSQLEETESRVHAIFERLLPAPS